MIHYDKKRDFRTISRELYPFTAHVTESIRWNLNQPGTWFQDNCEGETFGDDYYYGWSRRSWDGAGEGTLLWSLDRGPQGEVCGVNLDEDDDPYILSPSWPGEACRATGYRLVDNGLGDYFDQAVARTARTLYELHTGGKATFANPKRLFVLSGDAQGVGNPFWPEDDGDKQPFEIPKTRIVLGDLGRLGSDGLLYKALADGETYDITPTDAGNPYYTYDAPGQTKHTPYIYVNGTRLLPTMVAPDANYIVGQVLNFSLGWTFEPPCCVVATNDLMWTIEGHYFNHEELVIPNCSDCSTTKTFDEISLMQPVLTNCWWVSGGTGPAHTYTAKFIERLTFSNGQKVAIESSGMFHMYKPVATMTITSGQVALDYAWGDPTLHFGSSHPGPYGIKFSNSMERPPGYTGPMGTFHLVQTILSTLRRVQTNDGSGDWYRKSAMNVLDTEYPLPFYPWLPPGCVADSPHSPNLTPYQAVSISEGFRMCMEFQPTGGHMVPILEAVWGWSGSGTLSGTTWSGGGTPSTPSSGSPTETYSSWTNNITNFRYQKE